MDSSTIYKTEPAFGPAETIALLQDSYSVSFSVELTMANWPLLWLIYDDPPALLWWQMGQLYHSGWIWND